MVFERQRLFVIGDDDVIYVNGFADQSAGLGVRNPALVEIRTHPVAQALGLANVNHLTLGVLVEVHAWRGRDGADFLLKIHRGAYFYFSGWTRGES